MAQEDTGMYKKSGKYFIQYQLKDKGEEYPGKYSSDEHIRTDDPSWIPIPGDSVRLTFHDSPELFIVLSRYFAYGLHGMDVTIVVRPADEAEKEQCMGY